MPGSAHIGRVFAGMFLRWAPLFLAATGLASAADWRFYTEPCTRTETACHKDDPQLAEWALHAWQAASGGMLRLEKVTAAEHAQIRIHWADGAGGLYGEAQPIAGGGKRRADVYALPGTAQLG